MSAAVATGYQVIIGLETHVQLNTESKMFCGCAANYARAEPNTHVCPICLGMPGVLPVINRQAVDRTIMTGLALDCEIPEYAKFDRKNYSYPDLMKWYQISQYDLPLCVNGWMDVLAEGETVRVGITRVHLEEDTAKLTHVRGDDGLPASLIDVNRSGVPLMEVVGEPDLRTPAQAVAFGIKLRNLLRWIGVSTANMEDGALRIDANISVWPAGDPIGDVKVEVKNMNSFRALGRALQFEIERQIAARERGESLAQETRGWVEDAGETVLQRTKEYAHDYRYFPEPDLPPLHISRERVARLRARLPELPDAVEARLVGEHEAAPEEVAELMEDRSLTEYALAVIDRFPSGRETVTWIVHDVRRVLNERQIVVRNIPVPSEQMAKLLEMRARGDVSSTMAAEVLDQMFATGESPDVLVERRGRQISDADALREVARQVIRENPGAVADYRAGKDRAIQFLMGQVMRVSKGAANPGIVTDLLREELNT